MNYKDTYFLDKNEALKTSLQKNRVATGNTRVDALQICYYNADEPLEETPPENCIFVPFENVYNYFVTTKNRFPEYIDFTGTNFSENEKTLLSKSFVSILDTARIERKNLSNLYLEKLSKQKLDFSERPLRVFIPACRETTVMQYISRNIADAFEKKGYKVLFHIQDNEMQSCNDFLSFSYHISEFNPHITVNINHLNNSFLNEDVFNFVWFQDSMPVITDNNPIYIRKKDFIYALLDGQKNAINNKTGTDICQIQNFCVNENIFKPNLTLEKKQKIVFIGSSYINNITPYINSCGGKAKDILNDIFIEQLIDEVVDFYKKDGIFQETYINYLSKKYNKSLELINNYVIPYVIRDKTILEIIDKSLSYEIEIYGWGWEKYKELKPYYKGSLDYGEDISNVYNSATYCLVCHPHYIIQQRTLEAAASNCIPLVYDSRYYNKTIESNYDENLVFFQNLNDLISLLNKPAKQRNLQELVQAFSYNAFVDKIIKEVMNYE